MTDTTETPTERTVSDLLRDVLAQEDLDSCAIIAGTINLYREAIKRRGNNRDLYADDITSIFKIVRVLLAAADLEQGMKQFVPRALRGKPESAQ